MKPAHATSLTGLGVWSPTKASSAVIDPTLTAGNIFQMRVNASGSTLLNGFDITIRWDPTVLNGTTVTNKGGIFDSPMFLLSLNETRADHVRLAGVLLGISVPANGTIISFRVKVLSQGSTPVRIAPATLLLNGPPPSIPYFPIHGFFSNSPGTSDLLLSSETASKEQVTIGDKVQLTIGVQNIGIVLMTNVNVTLFANNVKINSTVLSAVPGNTVRPVILTWNTTSFQPGPYIMNATIMNPPSSDAFLGDNTLALEQVTLVIHELAMASVMPTTTNSPYTPLNASLIGSAVRIQAAVQNLGTVPEYANVTIYANDTSTTYRPIQAECGNPLKPCQPSVRLLVNQGAIQNQFIFQWNTTGLRVGLYDLKGVVDVIPGERNVTDNVLVQGKVTLFAGFNHDLGVEWNPPNTVLYTGANYTFTLGVTNNGKYNDSFTLTLFSNSTRLLLTRGTAIINKTYTTTFVWKTKTITPGLYTLLANVTDNSARDEYLNNNTLTSTVTLNLNHPPVASFTSTPSAPKAGDSILFNATLSSDPDSGDRIKYYFWNFGDGTGGNGKTLNHTYTAAGSYSVNLTVWDDYGAQSWLSQTVVVSPVPTTMPPTKSDNSLLVYVALAGGVAAIGVGAFAFLMFRRRKRARMQRSPKTTPTS